MKIGKKVYLTMGGAVLAAAICGYAMLRNTMKEPINEPVSEARETQQQKPIEIVPPIAKEHRETSKDLLDDLYREISEIIKEDQAIGKITKNSRGKSTKVILTIPSEYSRITNDELDEQVKELAQHSAEFKKLQKTPHSKLEEMANEIGSLVESTHSELSDLIRQKKKEEVTFQKNLYHVFKKLVNETDQPLMIGVEGERYGLISLDPGKFVDRYGNHSVDFPSGFQAAHAIGALHQKIKVYGLEDEVLLEKANATVKDMRKAMIKSKHEILPGLVIPQFSYDPTIVANIKREYEQLQLSRIEKAVENMHKALYEEDAKIGILIFEKENLDSIEQKIHEIFEREGQSYIELAVSRR
ncbi:MAG: hypothetical protein AABY40_02590 [Nanoarchaeota archaeon]